MKICSTQRKHRKPFVSRQAAKAAKKTENQLSHAKALKAQGKPKIWHLTQRRKARKEGQHQERGLAFGQCERFNFWV